VYVQQAMGSLVGGQRHGGKVERAEGGAVVAVADEFFRHCTANIFLGFFGGAADLGDKITFSKSRRGEINFSWLVPGSLGKISTAAPVNPFSVTAAQGKS